MENSGIAYSSVGIDDMINAGTYIISCWNEGAPWGGLHTIAISYDGTNYKAYNWGKVELPIIPSNYAERYICGYYLH